MELISSPKNYAKDSFHAIDPSETIERAKTCLRRFGGGFFYGLQDVGKADTLGVPIFKVIGNRRFNEWGKGVSIEQCQASAIMERVERVSALPSHRKDIQRVRSPFNGLEMDAVSRKEFGLINAHHIIHRNQDIDDIAMEWVAAYSLPEEKRMLVPAQQVFMGLKDPRFYDHVCTTGLAAGNTKEEAIVQAACEVIERHVHHRVFYNLPRLKRIDLESVKNSALKGLIRLFREKGFEIHAHDVSDGFTLCSISVFIFDPKEKVVFPSPFKVGTSTDPEIALIRALTEYVQGRAVGLNMGTAREHPHGFFGSAENMINLYRWLLENEESVPIEEIESISKKDFKEEAEIIAKDFREKGLNFLICDLTHPRIGIPVVRAMIPTLQPNFLLRGLHPLNRRACVTPHLKIHKEVMESLRGRRLADQDIDEFVQV